VLSPKLGPSVAQTSPRAATTERPGSDPISDPYAQTLSTLGSPASMVGSAPQPAPPPPGAPLAPYPAPPTQVPVQMHAQPLVPVQYAAPQPIIVQAPPVHVIIQNHVNVVYPQPYSQPHPQYPMTYAPPAVGTYYPMTAPYVRKKDPGVSTMLSFFVPGAGQLYNGQIGKGCVFLAVTVVNILLLFVGVGLVTGLVTWIWSMVDAHGSAERINRGEIVV
jgi:TM2 domain-containing membrane protein YozV